MNEVKIISLTTSGEVFKCRTNSGRPGFGIAGEYTLEDGRKFPTSIRTERKKNVPDSVESEKRYIAAGAMAASFVDGNYFGTVTKFTIGHGGLVPVAATAAEPVPA